MNSSLNSSRAVLKQCPDTPTVTALTTIIVITGIAGNALVIHFVRSDLKQHKTPDKVLLLVKSVNNILACCVSLPLQYFDVVHVGKIPLSLGLCNTLCFIKLFVLFFCVGVSHVTLAVLCFERYEAITKFPQHRLLTYRKAIQSVCFIVVTFFVVTLAIMSGYIVDFQSGNTVCEGLYIRAGAVENAINFNVNIGLITQTAIVITVSNTLCFTYLILIEYKLKAHLRSVTNTLGNQTTIKEVRMARSALAFTLTYICVWTPFGVARGLRNGFPDSTSIHCYYLTSFTVSYSTFSIVPFLYIIFDKRIENPFLHLRNHIVALTAQRSYSVTASTTKSTAVQGEENGNAQTTSSVAPNGANAKSEDNNDPKLRQDIY